MADRTDAELAVDFTAMGHSIALITDVIAGNEMAGELAALAARLAEEGELLDHERSLGAVKFETPETGVY